MSLGGQFAELLDLGDALDGTEKKREQGLAQRLPQDAKAAKALDGFLENGITAPRELVDYILIGSIDG